VRGVVSDARAPPAPADDAPDGTPAPSTAPETSATPPPPGTPEGDAQAVTDVGDACAYDPAQAAEARAAGEPPNKAD
jgi:polyisoprenyl-teichoic acid--peptidoglycan teichoic acid transferase